MDPIAPGIQSSLVVSVGTTFGIEIVFSDPGGMTFDESILQLMYNDAGSILGAGPSGPVADALAGTVATFDPLGGLVTPGEPLVAVLHPQDPAFASSSGAFGVLATAVPFTLGPGAIGSIFGFDFVAASVGASTVTVVADAGPIPEPSTFLLFGAGLAGLAVFRRRRAT
jgi:hypothetical protein